VGTTMQMNRKGSVETMDVLTTDKNGTIDVQLFKKKK